LDNARALLASAAPAAPTPEQVKNHERYLWLRNGEISAEYPYPVVRMGGDRLFDRAIWAEELDAAIDSAIEASTKGGNT
jgi:hypothetical protein